MASMRDAGAWRACDAHAWRACDAGARGAHLQDALEADAGVLQLHHVARHEAALREVHVVRQRRVVVGRVRPEVAGAGGAGDGALHGVDAGARAKVARG